MLSKIDWTDYDIEGSAAATVKGKDPTYRPRGGRGTDKFAHAGDGGRGSDGRVGGGGVVECGVEIAWEVGGEGIKMAGSGVGIGRWEWG